MTTPSTRSEADGSDHAERYAPAGTPAPVVAELNRLLIQATKSAGATTFYQSTGTEVYTTTPADLGKFQQAEATKWGRIIKAAGIEPE